MSEGPPPLSFRRDYCNPRGKAQASPRVARPSVIMYLLVHAVEARHRWFLSARYAAAGKRATHLCCPGVASFFVLSPGRAIDFKCKVVSGDLWQENPPLPRTCGVNSTLLIVRATWKGCVVNIHYDTRRRFGRLRRIGEGPLGRGRSSTRRTRVDRYEGHQPRNNKERGR